MRAMIDPRQVLARDPKPAALVGSNGQDHGAETSLCQQAVDGEVLSQFLIQFDLHPCPFDVLDLLVEDISGKTIFRNPDRHHAAGHGQSFEYRDRITPLGQPQGSGQSGRAGADHGHLFVFRPSNFFGGSRVFRFRDRP